MFPTDGAPELKHQLPNIVGKHVLIYVTIRGIPTWATGLFIGLMCRLLYLKIVFWEGYKTPIWEGYKTPEVRSLRKKYCRCNTTVA